jgi:hypothetical protein
MSLDDGKEESQLDATIEVYLFIYFFLARQPPSGPWPPPHSRGFLWFLDHTQRHTTVGRTPLAE